MSRYQARLGCKRLVILGTPGSMGDHIFRRGIPPWARRSNDNAWS